MCGSRWLLGDIKHAACHLIPCRCMPSRALSLPLLLLQVGIPGSIFAYAVIVTVGYSLMLLIGL